ncbi:cytochrome b5-like Heme/Steroid binding domain-containing protein [Colletotrichum karsti]|uniref:Cytochrome b5-like Heme/Steroid binding domain-containing protein n=1 Tax=Colletotrichum karsti TaxID=1095194 RepID=A0A9P6LQA5_9PEZI|nr:cytochrome b5-like Heme/Steroid binding domain-containing protein [Colletotrichum karsti]KAF9881431.1 cytochrome b5-like Heme/Steroid binding domain-containing protein [Colletotrichum karsti]
MHPADLPKSSWSQVYNTGPTRPPLRNGLSWMDPTYPTIDPRTLEEYLGNPIVSEKPDPAALDDLFLSERCQKDRQFGMKTYEASSMARLEAYYANQDNASDNPDGDALVVDESQWLRIWRRERWCVDFRQDTQTTGLPTFIWSANDLLVWQELRKCIQLADNILRMGAKDIWLQQLLSADGLEAVKVKIPHGSENEETIWRFKANEHYYPATTEGVLQHLNDPHFYCNVYWLFRDAFWHVISTKSQTEVGTAISYPHGQRLVMPITLDVLFLRTLMDPTATPFAKKTALCLQAITATDIHFLRRYRRDQERIERIIGQLLHPISLDAQDTENASADIFVPGCLPNFIAERSTTAWFFRAIGFLMAAALPARHHEGTYQYAEPKCREGLGIPWSIRQNLHMSRVEHDDLQYVIGQLCRSRWVYPQFKLGERHTAPTAQGVRDRRLQLIRFARDAYGIFELFCEHPRGLWTVFDQACHEMEIHLHLDMINDYESWIPFPFRMPEYPGVWEDGTASDLFQFGASAWEGWSFVRPLAGHHNTFVGERFMAEEVPSPDFFPPCPAWAMSGVAGAPIPVRTLTIADMYDEWKRLGKALLIVPGIDMDIYECDYVCKTLNITTERQWMESVETSWYGLQLNALAAARFRASDLEAMPLGRAVRIMRPDEIFSCNGENGNPLGIRIRNFIYDITSLTCSDMKLLRLLKSAPGRDPSKNVMMDGYEITEVVAGLKPYRVGMVYPTLCKAANKHSLKVFTERTLRRHEFKETGMYVAIFGKVYDITDYAEFHPGGLKFLEENAGRNITELFVQHHSRNLDRVMKYLPELHIGRMVEERTEVTQDQTIDQLHGAHITFNHDEIKFYETVYSVTALQESGEDPELVEKLRPYLGTDATADLQDEDADGGPLMCFARLRAYIVATTRRPDRQLPEMSISDLAKFDGMVNEREKWRNDAYVAVEDLVYDVTEVIQYGSTYERYANLGQYLGQKVHNETLATYLKNNCGHRVVARIVSSRIPCPFDPRRALPVRADITAWKARPKRKKPESAPKNPAPKRNDIAPYPQTVDDLKKKRKAKKTGKGHTFSPTPSISKLDYLVQSLSRTAQINGEPQVSNNYEGTRRWVEAQRIKTTRVREGITVKLPAIDPNAPAVVHLSTCTGAYGSETEGGGIGRAEADDLVPLELRSGGNPVRFTLRKTG